MASEAEMVGDGGASKVLQSKLSLISYGMKLLITTTRNCISLKSKKKHVDKKIYGMAT
jgi:hypothetical protein